MESILGTHGLYQYGPKIYFLPVPRVDPLFFVVKVSSPIENMTVILPCAEAIVWFLSLMAMMQMATIGIGHPDMH